MKKVEILPIEGVPMVSLGDDVAMLLYKAANAQGTPFQDEDIVVVTHKIVSKSEGRIVDLENIQPAIEAHRVAKIARKPSKIVQLALDEASAIIRLTPGHLITKTRHGWIYSCSGVDVSNVSGGDYAALLPLDPDGSAERIRCRLKELSGVDVGVIISDTTGRPFRRGDVDVAIGVSGIHPILDLRGREDCFGYRLKLKQVALADELASAAELVIGQADEKVPAAIVRGLKYPCNLESSSKMLQRSLEVDLFTPKDILVIKDRQAP